MVTLSFGAGRRPDSIVLLSGEHLENLNPQRVWEKGVLLEDAWLDVKNRPKIRAYQQIQSDEERAVHRKMRCREIMEDLSSGRFIAVGVKVLPEDGAPLEFIRRHLFNLDSNIDWEASTLEISNLNYIQIRILSRRKAMRVSRPVSDKSSYVPVEIKRENKSGPVGAGPAIKALYVRMIADGRLKNCRTVVAVRQKMVPLLEKDKINFPMGRGLSYPAFAKALKELRAQSPKG